MKNFSPALRAITATHGDAKELASALDLTTGFVSELRKGTEKGLAADTAARIVEYVERRYGLARGRELRDAWLLDRADPLLQDELDALRRIADRRKHFSAAQRVCRWPAREAERLDQILARAEQLPLETSLRHLELALTVLEDARDDVLRGHALPPE